MHFLSSPHSSSVFPSFSISTVARTNLSSVCLTANQRRKKGQRSTRSSESQTILVTPRSSNRLSPVLGSSPAICKRIKTEEENKKKNLKQTTCCNFVAFAGNDGCHHRCRRGEEKISQIHQSRGFCLQQHMNPHPVTRRKLKIQKQKYEDEDFLCRENRFKFFLEFFVFLLFYFSYDSPLILLKNFPFFCVYFRHLFIDKIILSPNTLVSQLFFLQILIFLTQ